MTRSQDAMARLIELMEARAAGQPVDEQDIFDLTVRLAREDPDMRDVFAMIRDRLGPRSAA